MSAKTPYQIFVHVIEGRGLYGTDETHMSNAYARIRLGPTSGLSCDTDAKWETSTAVWNDQHVFEDVLLTDDELRKEKLMISVYHRNDFQRDELIGSLEFSLTHIQRQKGSQYDRKWFPLVLPDQPSHIRGNLLISCYVLRPKAEAPMVEERKDDDGVILKDPKYPDRAYYLLNVLLYGGNHILENTQLPIGGERNPFVTVRFNGNVSQTTVQTNTSSPVWNTKISLPFSMPLTSESIELQLWNSVTGRPAQLIGEEIFNYYNQDLAYKPWGPRWVNFYSSEYRSTEVSWFGGFKESLDTTTGSTVVPSEYVGRVLVRMSVTTVEPSNQRLLIGPCNPVSPPPQVEYCLDLLLYRSAQLSIMGAQAQVQATFGDRRASSNPRYAVPGHSGVFDWSQPMEPVLRKQDQPLSAKDPKRFTVRVHGPADVEQLHDIILHVFHTSGSATRKIAFLRLTPRQLLPTGRMGTYFVNGQYAISRFGVVSERTRTAMWAPRWYTLNHVTPNPDRPHEVAGLLLMSIGLGTLETRPEVIPPLQISPSPTPFILRCYIYYGAHLPAADPSKFSSNPYLVVQFGNREHSTCTIEDTVFPYWCEWVDLGPVAFDKRHPPPLTLWAFHRTGGLGVPEAIGRADINGKHIMSNSPYVQQITSRHGGRGAEAKVYRYPLYLDSREKGETEFQNLQDEEGADSSGKRRGKGDSGDEDKSLEEERPYVLACFEFVPWDAAYRSEQKFDAYPLKKEWSQTYDQIDEDTMLANKRGRARETEMEPLNEGENTTSDALDNSDDDDADETTKALNDTDYLEADTSKPGRVRKAGKGKKREVEFSPEKIVWVPRTRQILAKLEVIGLRNIKNWKFSDDSSVQLEFTIPNILNISRARKDGKIREKDLTFNYVTPAANRPIGTAIQVLDGDTWDPIPIPLRNPSGVVMRIRAWQNDAMGRSLIGVTHTTLYSRDRTQLPGAYECEYYEYRGFWTLAEEEAHAEEMDKSEKAEKKAEDEKKEGDLEDDEDEAAGGSGGGSSSSARSDAEEAKLAELKKSLEGIIDFPEDQAQEAARRAREAQEAIDSGAVQSVEDRERIELMKKKAEEAARMIEQQRQEEAREKLGNFAYRGDVDRMQRRVVNLDDEQLNIYSAPLFAKAQSRSAKAAALAAKANANKGGDEDEDNEEGDFDLGQGDSKQYALPYSLKLMAGRQVGFSHMKHQLLQVSSDLEWRQAGIVRFYLSTCVVRSPETIFEDKQKLAADNHLQWLIENVYGQKFVTRVYVYEGRYLAPNEDFFSGGQSVNPYLVVSNSQDADEKIQSRDNCRYNTINPDFFQVFQFWGTEFPKNHAVEVGIWSRNSVTNDDFIGSVVLDAEDRIMRNRLRGRSEFHTLSTSTTQLSQGKLRIRLDVMPEATARRVEADVLPNQDPTKYELRLVIWNTRDVRMPEEKDRSKDVDQHMYVTVNFDGQRGQDDVRKTDVAWSSEGGSADWFWRMVYDVHLPSQLPRMKFSLWDKRVFGPSEGVGEINYNLKPLFDQALRDKKPRTHRPQQWIPFFHPNFPGVQMGEVCIELWLLTADEASKAPVGRDAQDEPNIDPVLPVPRRNPPPWNIGTRAVQFIEGRKRLIIALVAIVVIIVLVLAFVYVTR